MTTLRNTGAVVRAAVALATLSAIGAGVALPQEQARLYVPAQRDNNISTYSVDPSNGGLTLQAIQPTNGAQPYTLATTPNRRFLYAGALNGTIDAFAVSANGTLSALGAPFANAGSVASVAVESTGKFLYAANRTGSQVRVFSIDGVTGRLTALPSLTVSLGAGKVPQTLALDNAGHLYVALYGAGKIAQYTINSATGALTQIAVPIAAGLSPNRISISPSGAFLYATDYFSDSIQAYTIAVGSGALTANGSPVPTFGRPLGMAWHPCGQYLFVTSNSTIVANNVAVYSVGGAGALTLVTTAAAGLASSGITLDASGGYVYVSNMGAASVSRFAFDATTGALSATSPSTFAAGGLPQFPLLAFPPQ